MARMAQHRNCGCCGVSQRSSHCPKVGGRFGAVQQHAAADSCPARLQHAGARDHGSLGIPWLSLLTFGKLTNACRGRNKRREESLGNTCPVVAGRLHSISGDMAGNEDAALVLHDIHERGRAKKHQKTSKSQQMQTSADCFLEFIEW